MSPSDITFKTVFNNVVRSLTDNNQYVSYTNAADFTNKVKKCMRALAEDVGVSYYPEYYKVDYTFWDESDKNDNAAKKVRFNPWKWKLLALIEHENKYRDWNYEVFKLAPFCCPLRVVIGYGDKKNDMEQLNYLAKILKEMDNDRCFSKEGEFGIIIGNKSGNIADYRAYIYNFDNHQFIKTDW